MSELTINTQNPALDAAEIVEQIRARVAKRRENGEYDDATVARAELYNLDNFKDDKDFVDRYLKCLRMAVLVDINDFEIVEHRTRFAGAFKKLKRAIWGLLRFYTYRLWAQQNQANAMLLTATELIAERNERRIKELEARIERLEKQLSK